MDYYLDPTLQYPFSQPTGHVGKNPVMPILEHVFNPSGTYISAFKDCVLVSLDIEFEPCTQRIQQVGIATLDTREIWRADRDESITDIISSRLFILEKQKRSRGKYLFGDPEKQQDYRLASLLRLYFQIIDIRNTTKLRNTILVGHGIRADIEVIRSSSGLDLLQLPTIMAVIDTSTLLFTVCQVPGHNSSLRRTCTYLGMYRRNMHNAGNDAMYTLKALLLLFYHYKAEKLSHELIDRPTDQALLYECQLVAIKRIGRYNNGISRFSKKRKRKLLEDLPRWKESKPLHPDLLNLEGGLEEGIVDHFFQCEYHG